jgi:8-oxo-dGTP diphosphatase
MITVAIAIIVNENRQILITKRSSQNPVYAGFWEFPGGKVQSFETPIMALVREVKEELGIEPLNFEHFHTTMSNDVNLIAFKALSFTGIPECLESQEELAWVNIEHLHTYKFPKANIDIIKLLTFVN